VVRWRSQASLGVSLLLWDGAGVVGEAHVQQLAITRCGTSRWISGCAGCAQKHRLQRTSAAVMIEHGNRPCRWTR